MTKQYNAVLFVESPSKIRVYQNTLQNTDIKNYKIRIFSTKGHLREVIIQKKFDTSKNSIDIKWKEKSHVSSIIKQLKEIKFDNEKTLFIATDADREGEAIGWHLLEILKKHFKYNKTPYRLNCIELTKNKIISAINKSIEFSETICQSLINAYKARVTIDLVIGINGSCLLWDKLFGCKSLGRVQSISILKIFDLETKIRKFQPETYYKLFIQDNNQNIQIDKIYIDNVLQKEFKNIETAENIKKQIENQTFKFLEKKITYTYSNQIQPLDMSQLSMVANTKLGMKIKEMYSICQKLYDGSICYEGQTTGVITYMRTDSKYISPEFVEQIKQYITNNFGKEQYVEFEQKTDKNTIIQEAHEAIRPTFLTKTKQQYLDFVNSLDRKEKKVYQYILFRTLASFMKKIKYENTEYFFISNDNKYRVSIKCTKIQSQGYLAMVNYHECYFCYENTNTDNNNFENIQNIINKNLSLKVEIKKQITTPPERLTESKLIQELKKHNIGRPSTYSYIVETIKNRNYVQMINNKYYITDLGYLLCIFINLYLQKFINYSFTSEMEISLDKIAQNIECVDLTIEKFIKTFNENINIILKIERAKILSVIEQNILSEYISQCIKCKNKISLMFFKQKPCVCCSCGFIASINKIGYYDESNIPPNVDYSKNQQYIKKTRQNNYIKYKKTHN